MLAILIFSIKVLWPLCQGVVLEKMVGDYEEAPTDEVAARADIESAWRWREMWTVEMEEAWLMERQQMSWPEEVGDG